MLNAMRNDLRSILSWWWGTEDKSAKADSHWDLKNYGGHEREDKDKEQMNIEKIML